MERIDLTPEDTKEFGEIQDRANDAMREKVRADAESQGAQNAIEAYKLAADNKTLRILMRNGVTDPDAYEMMQDAKTGGYYLRKRPEAATPPAAEPTEPSAAPPTPEGTTDTPDDEKAAVAAAGETIN